MPARTSSYSVGRIPTGTRQAGEGANFNVLYVKLYYGKHQYLIIYVGSRGGVPAGVEAVPAVRSHAPEAGDLLRPDGAPAEEDPAQTAAGRQHRPHPGAEARARGAGQPGVQLPRRQRVRPQDESGGGGAHRAPVRVTGSAGGEWLLGGGEG